MSNTKIIIGLGNPGAKYAMTRHNAGHLFIEYLRNHQLSTINYQLFATDCFMNTSGTFVKKALSSNHQLSTNNLYIAHDDLDIPLGKYKISYAKGPKIHNGILSIEDALNTGDFWRIRIGIDNRDNHISATDDAELSQPSTINHQLHLRQGSGGQAPTSISGEQYVLSPFLPAERSILIKSFDIIHQAILRL